MTDRLDEEIREFEKSVNVVRSIIRGVFLLGFIVGLAFAIGYFPEATAIASIAVACSYLYRHRDVRAETPGHPPTGPSSE